MFNANPNVKRNPMAPKNYSNMPLIRDPRNPMKFGKQRIAGQLAIQPGRGGQGTNLNSLPFAGLPYARPRFRLPDYGY